LTLRPRSTKFPFVRIALGILAYIALYIALDWVSLIHPFGALAITPWNPPAGLTFALMLRYGRGFVPVAFAAIVAAEVLLHGLSVAPGATIAASLAIAIGYATAAKLLRDRVHIDLRLERQRDLLWLLGTTLVATSVVAVVVVAIFTAAGLVAPDDFGPAAVHFWVGDVIGIAVVTPWLLLLLERPPSVRWTPRQLGEAALQLLAVAAALWIMFGLKSAAPFEFSYVLFLPLIWIALRGGLRAASWGIVVTQLGLILAIQVNSGYEPEIVAQFQLLLLAVVITALLLGAVVDERRDNAAQLKTVVRTVPEAILTVTRDGTVLSANPAAERLFGVTAQNLATARLPELLPDFHRKAGAQSPVEEMIARRLDGTSFIADVAAGDAEIGGRPVQVAIVRDVTARKEAERRLKEREADLAHVARVAATGELASSLAHELNQPLTALIGFARACQTLLHHAPDDGEDARPSSTTLIDQVVQQALRAGEIIRTTREFLSRGDIRHERLELHDVVQTVLDLLASELFHRQVRVTSRFEPGLPPVLADHIQVEQILVNLLRNSIEALAGAGSAVREITLSARRANDDFVEIAMADTGPGFSPEVAARLFTRFASTKKTGMGLGLSISRSIVEAHGGKIWLVQRESGAEIHFTLPAYAETSDAA
jgi:two-component system sensor kinase FixL